MRIHHAMLTHRGNIPFTKIHGSHSFCEAHWPTLLTERKYSLQCLQELATVFYPEPNICNPRPFIQLHYNCHVTDQMLLTRAQILRYTDVKRHSLPTDLSVAHMFPSQSLNILCYLWLRCRVADHRGSKVWCKKLFRTLKHWDRGFESIRGRNICMRLFSV
jgi:hypothetical protein